MARVIGLLRNKRDGWWEVEFPDLPGCSARARSLADLRAAASSAVRAVLVERRDRGEPPPELSDVEKLARRSDAQSAMLLAIELPTAEKR